MTDRFLKIGLVLGLVGFLSGLPPKAAAEEDGIFVLFAVYYLESGHPYGSADYGLRISDTFCQTQKRVLLNRWRSEGGEPRAEDALWLPKQGYIVRLLCLSLPDFENRDLRSRLLRRKLDRR